MRLALDAVARGECCAMVSAGNTGALMASAKFALKTLPGIYRPAITATVPAQDKRVVLLDMGANIDCTAEYLVQFAMMGDAYARRRARHRAAEGGAAQCRLRGNEGPRRGEGRA
ncbi:MAG: hypothetical protein WDN72_08855 [Alphaproteobacteria bacterium]